MEQPRNVPGRPLSARSVAASTLLGVEPPALPAQVLVRSGELFGIAEGTTRVALSRMCAAGELTVDGAGRYALAGHLLERQRRQATSRRPRLRAWRGGWRVGIVTAERRPAAERSSLRGAMRLARLAEVREGVWARPDNLDLVVDEGPLAACTWATARFDEPAALAATMWDLDGWAHDARRLSRELASWLPRLLAQDLDALAPTFVLSADVLRHLQTDPLLPPALLPGDWPGEDLRSAYEEFNAAFLAVWRDWHRSAFRG